MCFMKDSPITNEMQCKYVCVGLTFLEVWLFMSICYISTDPFLHSRHRVSIVYVNKRSLFAILLLKNVCTFLNKCTIYTIIYVFAALAWSASVRHVTDWKTLFLRIPRKHTNISIWFLLNIYFLSINVKCTIFLSRVCINVLNSNNLTLGHVCAVLWGWEAELDSAAVKMK